mmetsp:Transcript_26679/g.57850  ORF Transcript_26679/g.57850 Transcript_26679/m.57850 type:complete len:208 (-) Transcript_26679:530-1153(-)
MSPALHRDAEAKIEYENVAEGGADGHPEARWVGGHGCGETRCKRLAQVESISLLSQVPTADGATPCEDCHNRCAPQRHRVEGRHAPVGELERAHGGCGAEGTVALTSAHRHRGRGGGRARSRSDVNTHNIDASRIGSNGKASASLADGEGGDGTRAIDRQPTSRHNRLKLPRFPNLDCGIFRSRDEEGGVRTDGEGRDRLCVFLDAL